MHTSSLDIPPTRCRPLEETSWRSDRGSLKRHWWWRCSRSSTWQWHMTDGGNRRYDDEIPSHLHRLRNSNRFVAVCRLHRRRSLAKPWQADRRGSSYYLVPLCPAWSWSYQIYHHFYLPNWYPCFVSEEMEKKTERRVNQIEDGVFSFLLSSQRSALSIVVFIPSPRTRTNPQKRTARDETECLLGLFLFLSLDRWRGLIEFLEADITGIFTKALSANHQTILNNTGEWSDRYGSDQDRFTLRIIPWPLEQTRHLRLPGPYLCGCERKMDEWPMMNCVEVDRI